MNNKLFYRKLSRIASGIIFMFIGLDSALTYLNHNSYKVFIALLAIIGGAGLLFEGIFVKKSK
ncbi:hypothetical protein [Ekhidna sp.]